MTSSTPLVDALHDLATMMAEPVTVEGLLDRVGHWTAEVLPVDGVGVLVRQPDGHLSVATASSETGRRIEELEALLQEGPCSRAFLEGTQVLTPDLRDHVEEYPEFAPRALELGVRSIHAVPMRAGSAMIGALDLIARDAVRLDAEQVATAPLLGDVTGAYLMTSRMLGEATELASALQHALDNSTVIEQAKGVLAERHGEAPTAAFERLRGHARANRIKVADVAAGVVSGELRL